MKNAFRRNSAIGLAAMGLTVAMAVPAFATGQDGLVNVNVGDVNVLRDVNVAAVVPVVAGLCGLDLNVPANVALLSNAVQKVDSTGQAVTICKVLGGDVKI